MASFGLQLVDLSPEGTQLEQLLKQALCDHREIAAMQLAWPLIGSEAATAVRSALNVDPLKLITGAWCKANEIESVGDRSKNHASQTFIAYLGQHSFTRSDDVILTVTIGTFSEPFPFTLELSVNIRSLKLEIRNGYITRIDGGDGDISAQLEYKTVVLSRLKSRKVRFPPRFDLKAPGLVIG